MFRYFLIAVVLLCTHPGVAGERKTVCVNMIIKNESQIIRRCLATVRPLIDYWVIVDTGSTDDTIAIVKDFMQDIPGELHERPWVDFAHNRNQALQLAKGKADYVLIIDADEVFALAEGFTLPPLDKDFYYITTSFGGTRYPRVQLVNNHLDWKWIGVLHEGLYCPQAQTAATLEGIKNVVSCDGARSKDPKKFLKDAQVLEAAMLKEPHNQRYQFYLAQSYRDAGERELALKNYEKRIAMGGWDEEIYWSMLQIGLLQDALKMPLEKVAESFKKAHAYRPSRTEPIYYLANLYRRAGNYAEGYRVSREGLFMPPAVNDILFVEKWVDDYGLMLEFSICAYWIDKFTEAQLASQYLLAKSDLPDNVRECLDRNMYWVNLKLGEEKTLLASSKK